MKDELIVTVASAFNADASNVNGDTEFRKLGDWDSFTALALIYGIEDAFGVLIGYGALDQIKTVDELADLVEVQKRIAD